MSEPVPAPGAERPLRILHAPRNIAGQAGDVAAALRRLGLAAELWVSGPDSFGRPADRVLEADPADDRATWDAVREVVDRFDVVHFHFGLTMVPRASANLPPFWDLPVYRAMGLRIYFTFHGSDVRIGRIFAERNPWAERFAASGPPDDDRTEKYLQVMRTYADRLFVASPNSLAYVPDAEYLPRVIDLSAWPRLDAVQRRARPVVVHAPTRRGTKGSDGILADLRALQEEGLDFEVRLLEGVPHDQVRAVLADSDILVDNTIAGSYGIVSMEAMALGKVALANVSDTMRAAHPDAPVVQVDPTTLRATLRHLILNPEERQALALRGRPFVEANHDAQQIARRLAAIYVAPRPEVTRLTMPDWASVARARRIELLEERLDRLNVDLLRTRRREADLRRRLDLSPESRGERTRSLLRRGRPWVRRVIPLKVRRRLGRLLG